MSKAERSDTPSGRLTLLTLARDLGVSRATVSNAYNRPDQLSPALRERILARAAELGFTGPDPMARGLRRGRVGAVGVLVDESLSYAFSDPTSVLFLDGLAREVQADGLGLLLHPARRDPAALQALADAAVDAWVVQSLPDGHPAVDVVASRGRPVVVVDQPALPGVPVVGIDDASGATTAVRHLTRLGHRRLAVLAMPLGCDRRQGRADAERQRTAEYAVMRRRLAGAAAAVAEAGLDWAGVPVVEVTANEPDAAARAARELLAGPDRPTGVFASTDQLALGVVRAARALGLAVPGDLSVVGFDDSPAARSAEPPLTTVAQPLRDRGQRVGVLVRAALQGEEVGVPPPAVVGLVVRGSTAPPPRGG
ncbi:LacI family DNA-binding transcriptional regulator [Modestobacter sp. I12A-02662]|uniref:LacI family DNA-binding transcriptional regulator n=1 Tax=Modestobacter sp. I12A-02662 TaxID=1730496 RepID=UPI0034DEF557